MKVVFILLLTSLMLSGNAQAASVDCGFIKNDWNYVFGTPYNCKVQNYVNITTRESAVIQSATGNHDEGKSNSDVEGFKFYNKTVHFFPRGVEKIFPNLKSILIISSELKEICQSDLRPFPNLKLIHLGYNDIQVLEDGLFDFNPNLESINLSSNKIVHIGANVFDNLQKLRTLYLHSNLCINMYAYSAEGVKSVVSEAKTSCQSNEFVSIHAELETLENLLPNVDASSLPAFHRLVKRSELKSENLTYFYKLLLTFMAETTQNLNVLDEDLKSLHIEASRGELVELKGKLEAEIKNIQSRMEELLLMQMTSINRDDADQFSESGSGEISMLADSDT